MSDIVRLTVADPTCAERRAHADVYAFGAHVTSWCDGDDELLFLSKTAVLDGSKPIRGGIPLCWPQFGGFGTLPAHGFARNRTWRTVSIENGGIVASNDEQLAKATFALSVSSTDAWPHACELQYDVRLSWHRGETASRLECRLRIANSGDAPLSFTTALHAYFCVSDIGAASVAPLHTLAYLDQLRRSAADNAPLRCETSADYVAAHFDAEYDRVYERAFERAGQASALWVRDAGAQRAVKIETDQLTDAVVWNAWEKKATSMADMEADGWRRYVCVEPARIFEPVVVAGGGVFEARLRLSVEAL